MLKFYKKYLSPILVVFLGHACRFTPTCSVYTGQAIKKYGIVRGGLMSVWRIVKCNPLSKVKYDPVI